MLLEISGELTPERMKGWSQSKKKKKNTHTHPVVHVTGDRSKVRCCKEQYCIGTWTVRSVTRQIESGQTGDGKSERRHSSNQQLKWTGMGEFNSDDHYVYYCRQGSLRRNGVAIMVNKRVQNEVLGCNPMMQSEVSQKEKHQYSILTHIYGI